MLDEKKLQDWLKRALPEIYQGVSIECNMTHLASQNTFVRNLLKRGYSLFDCWNALLDAIVNEVDKFIRPYQKWSLDLTGSISDANIKISKGFPPYEYTTVIVNKCVPLVQMYNMGAKPDILNLLIDKLRLQQKLNSINSQLKMKNQCITKALQNSDVCFGKEGLVVDVAGCLYVPMKKRANVPSHQILDVKLFPPDKREIIVEITKNPIARLVPKFPPNK